MSTPEKRRAGTGAHVLRAGSSHLARNASAGASTTTGAASASAAASAAPVANTAGTNSMPAVPPRAVTSAVPASADEPHDNVSPSAMDRKEKDGADRDGRDGAGTVGKTTTTTTTTGGSLSRSSSGAPGGGGSSRDKDKDSSSNIGTVSGSAARGEYKKQLRERDERIALLERELATMEREFQRELDKLSQNESETATFWQSKHSALNQQFLRTDTELRLLRTEVDVREGEREELRQHWDVLRRELADKEAEVRGLRGQVRGLKEFVSTSTRVDGQTTDEVFGDGMARLGNGLQNWVIVNFRKARLVVDLAAVEGEALAAEVNELVPMYEELVHTAKVHLLQSLVSRVLVDTVFSAYYVGLSEEQTTHFRQMEKLLSSFAQSDEAVNQWRASTLALIHREAPDTLREETAAFAESVMARIGRLLDALTGSSSTSTSSSSTTSASASTATTSTAASGVSAATSSSKPKPESRDSALRVLVNNSIELARLLVVQKAVLRVHMPVVLPHQRVSFEADTMDDIGGEDEDALSQRNICCVVFPGIVKHGDENGGHLQYRNVIAKAKVLCSPEE